jgi:hypothetical protein
VFEGRKTISCFVVGKVGCRMLGRTVYINGCVWVILIFDIVAGNDFLVLVRCVSRGNKLGVLALLVRWGWQTLRPVELLFRMWWQRALGQWMKVKGVGGDGEVKDGSKERPICVFIVI